MPSMLPCSDSVICGLTVNRQFSLVVPLFDSCHAALMRIFETVVVFAIAEAAVVCIITMFPCSILLRVTVWQYVNDE